MSYQGDTIDSESKRKSWPRGSFERAYPSCSSVLEAFYKAKKSPIKPVAAQVTEEERSLKEAISQIEEAQKDFDLDKISLQMRDRLAKMPLTTVIEISLWRDLWLKVLGEARF